MAISHRKEPVGTLESLTSERKSEQNKSSPPLFLASIVMPHQDDGLEMFGSAIVCLFGSCMDSDKVAT